MMGTQPRLGEDSPVMSLSGVTPAIKMIHDYSNNQTELRQKMEQIDDQIHKLLWVCRLRSVLLEIAGIERQPLWALGGCSLCDDGGDCVTGRKTVLRGNKDQSVETFLKNQNQEIFFLLNYALRKVMGITLNSSQNFQTTIKTFVLHY